MRMENENGEMRMEHGDVIQACKSTQKHLVVMYLHFSRQLS